MERAGNAARHLRVSRLLASGLYLVTDESRSAGRSDETIVEGACHAGATAVQLREKGIPRRDLLVVAGRLVDTCHRFGALLIVNSNPDIAVLSGADGVHLPATDIGVADVRKFAGPALLVGRSAHSVEEAMAAENEGADYITLGTIFPTPSKPGVEGAGVELVAAVTRHTRLPIIAIGGISTENAALVIRAGADAVAVVSAVTAAEDIRLAIRQLLEVIKQARSSASTRQSLRSSKWD
ncbi:MAG: thiamine phosphate synthase [Chloroflexi bacterium]|nr:thiamine phosphate synthase [Chloroflexota bacterium]